MITIDENAAGQRIDNFLMGHFKDVPHSRIYRILRKGEVRVNKKRIKPMYRLELGDEVRIPPMRTSQDDEVEAPLPSARLRQLIKESILYEDEKLLVLNKPPGIAVHSGSGIGLGVIETLRVIFPEQPFMELAHRLDRGTSGCLLVAKSRPMLLQLQRLLKAREIKKCYLLCVHGHWPKEVFRVDQPLQRIGAPTEDRQVMATEEGKEAVTEFTIKKCYPDYTVLLAKPQTGRTHQIRVHAASVNCPIVGDEKYGSRDLDKKWRKERRLCLHAWSLEFTLPENGNRYSFKAEPVDDAFLVAPK